MSEERKPGPGPDFDDADEQAPWHALGRIEREDPSPRLRQGFYARLESAARPPLAARLRQALGFAGNAGWITASACLLVGLATGLLVDGGGADERLAALEQNVTLLNRRLVLDRLENETPGKRLRGVMDAAELTGDDADITRALLDRATGDRVPAVRAAAIDALGSRMQAPAVRDQLMALLTSVDSPIVQLALVDMVLRYGSSRQHAELLALAQRDALHPDLGRHVITALQGETV